MKQAIYNNQYIDNKKQVYDILKDKKITLKYLGRDTMQEDSQEMYHYNIIINGVSFDYYEGLGHDMLDNENIHDKIINALWCLLRDADTLTFFKSIDSFMQEFGYLDYKKALNIFKGCKETKRKLAKIFASHELNILQDNINL